MKKDIKPLTSMRGIAAGLVFFYHFIYLRNKVPAQNVFDAIIQSGYIGVTIFFVLSGFVLTLRYADDVANGSFNWRRYMQRRVARIYPIYFFLLAGIALIKVPINVTNVTLTQGFFMKLHQTGLTATWSLTVEEIFYLMLPWVLSVVVRHKTLFRAAITLLLWTLAMCAIGLALVMWSNATGIVKQAGFMGDISFMFNRTVFGYMFDFSVGIFAALLYRRRGSFGITASTLLTIAGFGGIILFQWLMAQSPNGVVVRLFVYCVAVCTGILMYSLANTETLLARALSWSPLTYMGRISYAVYLVQLTQLLWFMSGWPVLMFYIGTNLVSAVLYQFIEEPARKLISSLGRPRTERRTAPALSFGTQANSRDTR